MIKNFLGKTTPKIPAIAIVNITGSNIKPRKALGKPSKFDCQLTPTLPQLMIAFILQLKEAEESLANLIASTAKTNEAPKLKSEDMSIVQ